MANDKSNEVYHECEEALSVAASQAVLSGTTEQGDNPVLTQLRDAADMVSQTTESSVDSSYFGYTARGNGKIYARSDPANWLRCVFGNPFQPVHVDPAWLTSDVISLATGIYDEKAFDRMPILADALQDAGCDNEDVLNHCRSEGLHVRGCWVVDLLTGRK